jgi:hypothetical protein
MFAARRFGVGLTLPGSDLEHRVDPEWDPNWDTPPQATDTDMADPSVLIVIPKDGAACKSLP